MLDARKQEVYVALFRWANGTLARLSDDGVMSVQNAVALIQDERQDTFCTAIGDGAHVYRHVLLHSLGPHLRIATDAGHSTVAYRVAQLARARFAAVAGADLGRLVPLYLRPSEAQSKRKFSALTY